MLVKHVEKASGVVIGFQQCSLVDAEHLLVKLGCQVVVGQVLLPHSRRLSRRLCSQSDLAACVDPERCSHLQHTAAGAAESRPELLTLRRAADPCLRNETFLYLGRCCLFFN